MGAATPAALPRGANDYSNAFRYDGLKLILQSGDQYLLLPANWSPRNAVAVLLPKTDTVRLAFTPAAPVPATIVC